MTLFDVCVDPREQQREQRREDRAPEREEEHADAAGETHGLGRDARLHDVVALWFSFPTHGLSV